VRRLVVTLLIAACGAPVDDPDATTSGGPGLECLYDGDCGEQARCHDGTCVLQCEGADCCMLLGECESPPSCDDTRDCPRGHICDAGTCELPPGLCAPPPELAHG
jgi:hypothetical protein